jgi:acetyl esterase/lipase
MGVRIDPELAIMEKLTLPDYADVNAVRSWLRTLMSGQPCSNPAAEGIEVENRKIEGVEGEPPVPVRIYRPRPPATGILVYLHGGSMIMGDLEMEDAVCLRYTREAGCITIGVDYRLAPEHRFPAAINDAFATLRWAAANAHDLGAGDTGVAVGGHSSGGMLAAGVSIMSRDRRGPAPSLQMLIYAPLDDRLTAASVYQELPFDVPSRAVVGYMWRHYLGGSGVATSAYAAPARVSDLSGLAPAYIEAPAIDRIRDDSISYATRLLQAGITTELHVLPGAVHGFDTVPGARLTAEAYAMRAFALRRAFAARGAL